MKVSRFTKLALVSTIATYLLIFVGGLVRVSGAGLGCPDWPKCFGRWYPPTDVSQIPAGVDPSTFNFTLAWIEYVNRLLGMTIGLLILATAIIAIIRYRAYRKILFAACAAALLTAFQGWQGSVVVSSELEPIIVSVHMILALVIVSLLIYTTLQSYYLDRPDVATTRRQPSKLKLWTGAVWVVSMVQIAMGTQIREVLEHLTLQYPLLPDTEILARAGMMPHLHMTLGMLIAGGVLILALWVGSRRDRFTPLVVASTAALVLLAIIQIFTGVAFMVWGTPPIVEVFHLWIASLMIGSLLVVYSASRAEAVAGGPNLLRVPVSTGGK